jgi:hypothetical protein
MMIINCPLIMMQTIKHYIWNKQWLGIYLGRLILGNQTPNTNRQINKQ